MLHCKVLALALTLAALTACSSTSTTKQVNNPGGNYLGKSNWYWTEGGMRYATDGTDVYYLSHADFPAGQIRGVDVGTSECWKKVGGSHLTCYIRFGRCFEDSSLKPEFVSVP